MLHQMDSSCPPQAHQLKGKRRLSQHKDKMMMMMMTPQDGHLGRDNVKLEEQDMQMMVMLMRMMGVITSVKALKTQVTLSV